MIHQPSNGPLIQQPSPSTHPTQPTSDVAPLRRAARHLPGRLRREVQQAGVLVPLRGGRPGLSRRVRRRGRLRLGHYLLLGCVNGCVVDCVLMGKGVWWGVVCMCFRWVLMETDRCDATTRNDDTKPTTQARSSRPSTRTRCFGWTTPRSAASGSTRYASLSLSLCSHAAAAVDGPTRAPHPHPLTFITPHHSHTEPNRARTATLTSRTRTPS